VYRAALRATLAIDALCGHATPTMYGVIVRPNGAVSDARALRVAA
jgi:hypothetical protein